MISYMQSGVPDLGIDKEQDATCYVGELDQKVTEDILWELFVQVGVVSECILSLIDKSHFFLTVFSHYFYLTVNVHIPRDKITNTHGGFGFVEFRSEEDADYAIRVMNNVKLYGKIIKVNRAFKEKKSLDVGANLFVGNLSPEVTEKDLLETFGRFGIIISTPKIVTGESGESKGFAFISFDSFEASDAAIEALNTQYLCGRPINVQYAIKKESKSGERYGTAAERLLAAKKIALRLKSVDSVYSGTGINMRANAPSASNPIMNRGMMGIHAPMPQMPPPGLDGRMAFQPQIPPPILMGGYHHSMPPPFPPLEIYFHIAF